MSCKMKHTNLMILALFCLAVGPLWAAVAKVEGVVVDPEQNPVRGAVVTITPSDGSAPQSAETNRRGKFSISIEQMAPEFTVRVVAESFATYDGPIVIEEGKTLDVTIPLVTREVAEQQRAEIAAIEARNKAARRYNEGANKYNEGDFEAAIALFREALAEEEELAIAWAGLGRIYLEQEKLPEAADALENYERVEPGKEPVLQMLYDCYYGMASQGDDEQAKAANKTKADALLERLVTEFPSGGTAARVFNLGVQAIKANRLEEAMGRFEQAVAIHPELYQAYLNMAHIHRAYGRWDETLTSVDKFLAAEEGHARALALRYQALKALGRADEASAALASLRGDAPGEAATIFHEQGVNLFNAGELEAALNAFLAAIEIQETHARAHYRAGLCYASMKNNAQAKAFLEKFIELAPDDSEATTAKEMLAYL